jgi:tetratricopeptide (TPR) repeat protein
MKGKTMKNWIITTTALGLGLGIGLSMNRPGRQAAPEPASDPTPAQADTHPQSPLSSAVTPPEFISNQTAAALPPATPQPPTASHARPAALADRLGLDQALQTILSPQSTYAQKKAAWKQLKQSGKLDQAIADLEQQVSDDPKSAPAITALGESYIQKCGQVDDIRQSAILVMKADQTFDAALAIDPTSWDALYNKAVGMSYWAPKVGKGDEVFQQFQSLIQQQESEPSQPQFALSYVQLGEQYAKAGYPDQAIQVWQRGAALFPNNDDLQEKLAAAAKPQ